MPIKLKPGDRVAVSISPPVSLTQYDRLKAYASISREVPLNADPDEFMAELTQAVRETCYEAMCTELGVLNELTQAIADGLDLETFLKERIRNEPTRHTVENAPHSGTEGKVKRRKKTNT